MVAARQKYPVYMRNFAQRGDGQSGQQLDDVYEDALPRKGLLEAASNIHERWNEPDELDKKGQRRESSLP